MLELLVWGPVVWDSNGIPLKIPIPFIFGDPRNPNHRAPNQQLITSWVWIPKKNTMKDHRKRYTKIFENWNLRKYQNISILNLGLLSPSGIELLRLKKSSSTTHRTHLCFTFPFWEMFSLISWSEKQNYPDSEWIILLEWWTKILQVKVDNAHLTVEHQHVDQETLHRQYDLAVAGQGLLTSGKLNSDGYTPRKWTNVTKKKRLVQ